MDGRGEGEAVGRTLREKPLTLPLLRKMKERKKKKKEKKEKEKKEKEKKEKEKKNGRRRRR
jgi:hypothetical protein